nr:hypothetical protein [Roseivirga sp. UBA838]
MAAAATKLIGKGQLDSKKPLVQTCLNSVEK